MKPAMAVCKVLILFFLAALLGVLVACLPQPEESVEWVRREDGVIVQMLDVGGLPQTDVADRATAPSFTLYGDGTLIFVPPEQRSQFLVPDGQGEYPIYRAQLSPSAVEQLLKSITNTGFPDFAYEQPEPGSRYDFPTTFLYVHTKQAANAVRAYALTTAVPEGKEWSQFRRIQQIREGLDFVAAEAAQDSVRYRVDGVTLLVQPLPPAERPALPAWPLPDIDLAAVAPGQEIGERRLEGSAAAKVAQTLRSAPGGAFVQRDRTFSVALRPVLPFEEHFPEFETPR